MTSDRAGYIAGLRQLADLLQDNPEIPLPYTGRPDSAGIHWINHGTMQEQREFLAAIKRHFPLTDKRLVLGDDTWSAGSIAGLRVEVCVTTAATQ